MPIAEIDGLKIAFDHHRPKGEPRQRIVFVHGTGCNKRVFDRPISALVEHYEILVPDLPGHGDSSGDGYRGIADYAFSVGHLLEHLGWRDVVVAGHSMGGGIALAMAIYFSPLIRALMLIDTGARLRVSPTIINAAKRAAQTGTSVAGDPRYGFAANTSSETVDAINAITAQCRPEVRLRDWIADDTCDFMGRLAQIDVPSVALCGDEDEFTPVKYSAFFERHLPQCRMAVINGAGHWPFVEQPQAFDAEVSKFLESLAG